MSERCTPSPSLIKDIKCAKMDQEEFTAELANTAGTNSSQANDNNIVKPKQLLPFSSTPLPEEPEKRWQF